MSKTRLARHGLGAYAKHPLLRAVGIDRTYYAPLPAEAFAQYAASVPEDFRFLVKASGECTSPYARDATGRPAGPNPLYLDGGFAADEIVAPFVDGLGDRAGPLLFQFAPQGEEIRQDPPGFADRLGRFLGGLPPGPAYAVELRDAELASPEYFSALEESPATHCFSVHPRMPSIPEQRRLAGGATDGPLVVRWMLHAGQSFESARERYEPFSRLVDEDPDSRDAIADICLEWAQLGRPIVVIANNKAEGSAPLTVFKLAEALTRSGRS